MFQWIGLDSLQDMMDFSVHCNSKGKEIQFQTFILRVFLSLREIWLLDPTEFCA